MFIISIIICDKLFKFFAKVLDSYILSDDYEHNQDQDSKNYLLEQFSCFRTIATGQCESNMVIVSTSLGKIKGRFARTKGGKIIYSFKGLPYAEPPIGPLRFAAPKPVKPWSDSVIFSGKKDSSMSLQVPVLAPESKFILGSEDCLYLNVFTPQLPGDNGIGSTYPVIVWIHGGAFCVGSNDSQLYGPDYLLDYGVVLVTINYRYESQNYLICKYPFWIMHPTILIVGSIIEEKKIIFLNDKYIYYIQAIGNNTQNYCNNNNGQKTH